MAFPQGVFIDDIPSSNDKFQQFNSLEYKRKSECHSSSFHVVHVHNKTRAYHVRLHVHAIICKHKRVLNF